MKKASKIIILVIVFVFIVMFRFNIRYFIDGGENALVAPPDAFAFRSAVGKHDNELYYLSNEPFQVSANEDGYDSTTNTYHLFVDSYYLGNDDASLYVSGSYWNCPYKPIIKVDGNTIDDDFVSIENTGYANGIFSDCYISKLYHFIYQDRVSSEHTYEFYVRCNENSESVNVVFHCK